MKTTEIALATLLLLGIFSIEIESLTLYPEECEGCKTMVATGEQDNTLPEVWTSWCQSHTCENYEELLQAAQAFQAAYNANQNNLGDMASINLNICKLSGFCE